MARPPPADSPAKAMSDGAVPLAGGPGRRPERRRPRPGTLARPGQSAAGFPAGSRATTRLAARQVKRPHRIPVIRATGAPQPGRGEVRGDVGGDARVLRGHAERAGVDYRRDHHAQAGECETRSGARGDGRPVGRAPGHWSWSGSGRVPGPCGHGRGRAGDPASPGSGYRRASASGRPPWRSAFPVRSWFPRGSRCSPLLIGIVTIRVSRQELAGAVPAPQEAAPQPAASQPGTVQRHEDRAALAAAARPCRFC